jgi:hypothetical protein
MATICYMRMCFKNETRIRRFTFPYNNRLTDSSILNVEEDTNDVTDLPPLAVIVANGRVNFLFVVAVIGPRHVVVAKLVVCCNF